MGLTKQQLEALNNNSFPNNNAGAITPAILRDYNVATIANTVNQDTYTADSASFNSRILAVDDSLVTTASFNAFTQSTNTFTASISTSVGLLQTFSGSQYKADSASFSSRIAAATGSVTSAITASSLITASVSQSTITFTKGDGSQFNIVVADISGGASINTGSFATTGSNSFTGSQTINGNIILTGSNAEIQNAKGVGIYNSLYNLDYKLTMPIQNTIGYIDELNLPHYYNGGVQPTISASATINNHNLVKVTPQQWFNLTASVGDNHTGILAVEQATGWDDINNTFGVHGNFVTSGSVNYITQRGLSKVGIFKLGGSIAEAYIGQPVYVDDNGYQLTLGYPTGSRVLRYGYVASFEQTDPLNMYVRQIFVDPVWEKGETVVDLNVSSSLRITGSLNVTGSTYFSELTSSLATYSASVSSRINAITSSATINTGSFAVTSSNTFTGIQTLSDVDLLNQIGLDDHSGSLVLFGKGFTSSSLTHITASSTANTNIIFKVNNNTPTTIVSGSNNLFVNAAAAAATFNRYIGGLGNIALNASNVPQISQSMAFSPTMNNNYIGGAAATITMRGPASSSAWSINSNFLLGAVNIGGAAASADKIVNGLTFTGNSIAGNLIINANQSTLAGTATSITNNNINGSPTLILSSSTVAFTGNTINASSTITNQYFSGSLGTGQPSISNSTLGGTTQNLIISGGMPAGGTQNPAFANIIMNGTANTLYSNVAAGNISSSIVQASGIATHIFGANLIVSASSGVAQFNTIGSAFIGRYNDISGNKAKTGETVFAVGTGNTVERKTGFLIDSGSNTFVEGTFNVSGSTSFTGSVTIQSGSAFFANGNKQFNVGAFQSNITQSGSANVSQSMNFETTDISSGVTIASNSRITLANSGTYNIQFSAQIDRISGSGVDDVYIWLKKNGVNVANTTGQITVSGGATQAKTIQSWNYVVETTNSDYWELVWQSTDSNIRLSTFTPGGNIPNVPSIILTVTQVR